MKKKKEKRTLTHRSFGSRDVGNLLHGMWMLVAQSNKHNVYFCVFLSSFLFFFCYCCCCISSSMCTWYVYVCYGLKRNRISVGSLVYGEQSKRKLRTWLRRSTFPIHLKWNICIPNLLCVVVLKSRRKITKEKLLFFFISVRSVSDHFRWFVFRNLFWKFIKKKKKIRCFFRLYFGCLRNLNVVNREFCKCFPCESIQNLG